MVSSDFPKPGRSKSLLRNRNNNKEDASNAEEPKTGIKHHIPNETEEEPCISVKRKSNKLFGPRDFIEYHSKRSSITNSDSEDLDSGIVSDTELTISRHAPTLQEKWDVEFLDKPDPAVAFFYHPRTILLLLLMLGLLVYVAIFVMDQVDTVTNIKTGIMASTLVFLFIGMLQFRDGPFVRPHKAFWRLILSASVVYEIALVFILFQQKDSIRLFLQYIDTDLGKPLPDKSYAEDCSLTFENIYNQMDIFVIAHALGWYGKALILRDWWFCWILSVMFEVMEYSLQHQLPNFAECFWDHWGLDVFGANLIGIYFGMKTCEFFAMKQYSWRGWSEIPNLRGKLSRSVQQFTPHSWTTFDWYETKTVKNYVGVLALLFLFLQCELNAFYLKFLLWLPPSHFLNVWRLILFFLMGLPGTREFYQYLSDRSCKRLGAQAWMICANILTELLICIKFGTGEFEKPFPIKVQIFWFILLTAILIQLIFLAIRDLREGRLQRKVRHSTPRHSKFQ